jgi:hypothetical protein
MVKTEIAKSPIRRSAPRILKATLWGTVTFLVYYLPYNYLLPSLLTLPGVSDLALETSFSVFLIIVVFFAVIIKLFSGSIFQHVFSIARGLILMVYFIYAFEGGIMALAPSIGGATFNIILDLRILLAMFILISLLGIGKSLLHAIDFLSREREPLPM